MKKPFFLVAMLKSIRILLSIVAHYDYEIWQMDVKIAFLNDNLDEEIYMMQRTKSIWFASWQGPFIDLRKHLGHGTSNLIKQSGHLFLIWTKSWWTMCVQEISRKSSNFPSALCWWYSTHWEWCRGNVIGKYFVVKLIWYEGLGWD